MTRTETEIQNRKNIEREWATHLDTCEDPACTTCAAFDTALYGA
jgi:hypothetical protein